MTLEHQRIASTRRAGVAGRNGTMTQLCCCVWIPAQAVPGVRPEAMPPRSGRPRNSQAGGCRSIVPLRRYGWARPQPRRARTDEPCKTLRGWPRGVQEGTPRKLRFHAFMRQNTTSATSYLRLQRRLGQHIGDSESIGMRSSLRSTSRHPAQQRLLEATPPGSGEQLKRSGRRRASPHRPILSGPEARSRGRSSQHPVSADAHPSSE